MTIMSLYYSLFNNIIILKCLKCQNFYEKVSFYFASHNYERICLTISLTLYYNYDLVPYNFDCHCFNHNYDLL